MEYGEPSEEELKSYTDTARVFKFDLGWLSASKFQEVVYHAVPLTSGKSDFYHDNIAELRKKSRKFRAVLLLSEQASKMDLRTSDPTHQDLVERLTNGPDGGQNELVLAQQFATVAVKVLVENLEIIAPNDIDTEVMAGTSNGTLDGAADAGKSGDKARKEKKKMISKAHYQKLDQYSAHLRFKQDKQPNEKNKPNKPGDISSFADFLTVCERIYRASTATRHTLHATKLPNLRMHSQLKSRLLIATQRLPPARQIPALKLINRLRLSLRAHLMLPRRAWMWTHSFEMSFNHISVANLPQMLPRSLTCARAVGESSTHADRVTNAQRI